MQEEREAPKSIAGEPIQAALLAMETSTFSQSDARGRPRGGRRPDLRRSDSGLAAESSESSVQEGRHQKDTEQEKDHIEGERIEK